MRYKSRAQNDEWNMIMKRTLKVQSIYKCILEINIWGCNMGPTQMALVEPKWVLRFAWLGLTQTYRYTCREIFTGNNENVIQKHVIHKLVYVGLDEWYNDLLHVIQIPKGISVEQYKAYVQYNNGLSC